MQTVLHDLLYLLLGDSGSEWRLAETPSEGELVDYMNVFGEQAESLVVRFVAHD